MPPPSLSLLVYNCVAFIFRVELFNALYRRVLCRNRMNDDQLTVTSLQALAKVYKRYHEEIGCFSDMAYILQLLDRVLNLFANLIALFDFYHFCSVSRQHYAMPYWVSLNVLC